MTKPVVRGVIFDCDGVLVNTENLANAVLTDLLCSYGCPMDVKKTHDFFLGGTLASVGPAMAEKFGITLPDTWVSECYAKTFEAFKSNLEPYADLAPILDLLDAKGIPMAIGSNGPHDKMDVSLGKVGLKERFNGNICSAHDVANAKPHPDVYLLAAEKIGVPISECVVVDDSQNGVRAGAASGAITIGLVDITPADMLRAAGADYIASDHKELNALLDDWLTGS
ncbi:HAD family hydrolase [Thalassospira lucentensis]|uniref:HAD family phosphatase n=1 Tax=Thalassospira lucentensis TaxID=168935 RepID=A0A358HXX6_9PROT|nr:HAD family phosphatase [Thalassospira lucentensis]HBV00038.1 HAD family phosphatase [Thalassospira lucentensis]HCW69694.1 HAD family phosphatase [Thalassospira lucentensis]|tara:strand:- start:140 stop:814 length:675 start_codon:yes stop_codon:yes gene_type:complete